jgi:hypothetical protein
MILYLTDNTDIARHLRHHLEHSAENNSGPSTSVVTVPDRLTGAAAQTGHLTGELHPEIVAVVTFIVGDTSDRRGVIYRCHASGETWMPDILVDHPWEALSVTTAPVYASDREDQHHRRRSGPDTPVVLPLVSPLVSPVVSPAAAGALGGALSLLPPARVVGMAAGSSGISDTVAAVVDLATAARNIHIRSAVRRTGGEHVTTALNLCRQTADRLRCTATVRSRLLQAAGSAALRSGEVPPPLLESRNIPAVTTKAQSRSRLAELERSLTGWYRVEI